MDAPDGPPVTRVEHYLAAIHHRLGELLERLDGGQEDRFTSSISGPGDKPAARKAAPAKRTRTRNRA